MIMMRASGGLRRRRFGWRLRRGGNGGKRWRLRQFVAGRGLALERGLRGGEAELVGVGMLSAEGGVGGDVGAVEVGALFDHLDGAVRGGGGEFGNEGGFGEILPILLGHLGLHRIELEASGVEDAGVVGAPVVFELVVFGGLRGVDTLL